MQPPEAKLILVAHVVAKGLFWVHGTTEAGGCVDFQSPCYHQRSCGCLWSVQLPESALMSIGQDAVGAMLMSWSVQLQRSMMCSWPMLQQRAMLMSLVCTATRDHAEVRGMC